MNELPPAAGLGLGIDGGGTQTRWALALPSGAVVAEGSAAGLSALQLCATDATDATRAAHALLAGLCHEVLVAGRPARVWAGLSGYGGEGGRLRAWLAARFSIEAAHVTLSNDIEIAYRDHFTPGQGYLVYAGTGSIAALIDEAGVFHRAGGRGVLLDDGGGGYWIAREALRQVWRREDEAPGSWTGSALARALFAQIGGSDWAASRAFMYGQERGAVGRLALAVAAAADADPAALAILRRAGRELARLALAMHARYGPRPLVLSGRAAQLHPAIAEAMLAALPATMPMARRDTRAHRAAARLAAVAAAAAVERSPP
ncbi:MAG: BadF/BadG/BcrA/BcrD ATPase family protein [Pseudomonadota bacterium]